MINNIDCVKLDYDEEIVINLIMRGETDLPISVTFTETPIASKRTIPASSNSHRIGKYSREERKERIERWLIKRRAYLQRHPINRNYEGRSRVA